MQNFKVKYITFIIINVFIITHCLPSNQYNKVIKVLNFKFHTSYKSEIFIKFFIEQLSSKGFKSTNAQVNLSCLAFLNKENVMHYDKAGINHVLIQVNDKKKLISIFIYANQKDSLNLNKILMLNYSKNIINNNSQPITISTSDVSFEGKFISSYNHDFDNPKLENIAVIIPNNSITINNRLYGIENVKIASSISIHNKTKIEVNKDRSKTIVMYFFVSYSYFEKEHEKTSAYLKSIVYPYKVRISRDSLMAGSDKRIK